MDELAHLGAKQALWVGMGREVHHKDMGKPGCGVWRNLWLEGRKGQSEVSGCVVSTPTPCSPLHHHHIPLPVCRDVWRLWAWDCDAAGSPLDGSERAALAVPEEQK